MLRLGIQLASEPTYGQETRPIDACIELAQRTFVAAITQQFLSVVVSVFMIRRSLLPQSYTDEDEVQILGQAERSRFGPVIRVLVWNILKGRRRRWPEDFSHLVADRDLVLFQEAVLNTPTDALFTQSQRFEWVMARSFRDPISGTEHGVKTGSIVPSLSRRFYLSPSSEPVVQTQKLLLLTEYPLSGEGESLLVLNMHAINFVSVRKYTEQLDQLQLALRDWTGPIVLAGDFNTWNPQRLGLFFEVAREAKLEEAVMQRRSKLAHLNQHLDHVFYRGLKLRDVSSLRHFQSSDHAPITATFEQIITKGK